MPTLSHTAIVAIILLSVGIKELQAQPAKKTTTPQTTVSVPGLRLIAHLRQDTVGMGEPIVLELNLRNESGRSLHFTRSADLAFKVEVKNSRGESVPLTKYGSRRFEAMAVVMIRIATGQEIKSTLLVNRIHDMTESGAYSIVARTTFKGTESTSNAVQVTVLEPNLAPLEVIESKADNPGSPKNKVAPQTQWQEGDTWKLSLDLYTVDPRSNPQIAIDGKPMLLGHYSMKVKVAGTEEIGEGDGYWQLDFIPDRGAPGTVRDQSYRVLVSKKDGLMRAIIGLRGYGNDTVETSPDRSVTFTREAKPGYPLELLPFWEDQVETTAKTGWHFAMNAETKDGQRVAEAKIKKVGQEGYQTIVRQKWAPGAKWWSEYEKEDLRWKMILKAKLIPSP